MKINLKISQDGMNYESFHGVEFPKLDNKSEDAVKSEVESYCNSALGSMITKEILEMKVRIQLPIFSEFIVPYKTYIIEKYPNLDIMGRVDELIKTSTSDILIDDLIGVLQAIKPVLNPFDVNTYNIFKAIVFEHCQLDDPNSI
jgi:hypothetical protein